MITLINNKEGIPCWKTRGECERIEKDPVYFYAKTELKNSNNLTGTGFSFTPGNGNDFECLAESFDASHLNDEII
jgi:L-fuconate dehydratase